MAAILLTVGLPWQVNAALSYDVTLGAGVRLDDNLHLDPRSAGEHGVEGMEHLRQPVEETILTVNPGVRVLWGTEHDRLDLSYNGEYTIFEGDEARDAIWLHNIAAELNWRRWAPFFLEAREGRTRVPRNQEREGEAFVDQVDRNQITLRTGFFSEMGPRNTLELAYRRELVSYSVIAAADSGGQKVDAGIEASGTGEPGVEETEADEFDGVDRQFGELLIRHRWSPLWAGEARLKYGKIERELVPDYDELNVFVAVDQRWSEHLTLRYTFEWRRENEQEPESGGAAGNTTAESAEAEVPSAEVRNGFLFAALMRGDLERGGSWNLGYLDMQEDQANGDTLKTGRAFASVLLRARLGSTLEIGGWRETRKYRESGREELAWGPTLGARWLIAPWAALDLGGSWTSTTIREEELDEVEDQSIRATAGIVLLLFKRLQVEAGYGFRENQSTDALRSYANNIIFALMTFHFQTVAPGRLPPSYAAGLVAGGTSSRGVAQPVESGDDSGPVR